MPDLLATLQELEHLGVGFVSLTEALNLTTPAGRAMAAMLAVFAEFEREVLRERVRAGLAHARQNGRRLLRPASAALHAVEVRKLRRSGFSKSAIARRLNIGRTSVRRILNKRTPGLGTWPKHDEISIESTASTRKIIVDAYGPEEQAMSWYYDLEDKLQFPFHAQCVASVPTSPLHKGETVVDKSTTQAIEDWHYWIAQRYCF